MGKFANSLFGQIVIGLLAGILVGWLIEQYSDWFVHIGSVSIPVSDFAGWLKSFSDVFIRAVQMVIGPLVLCMVVTGIANTGGGKQVGRLGGKSLIYFFAMTVIALGFGSLAGNLIRPGDGMNADPAALDPTKIAQYARTAEDSPSIQQFLIELIPSNAVGAFADNQILQILIFSVLLGLALASMGDKGRPLVNGLDVLGHALMRIVGFIMKFAPLAAFGSMAFAVGQFGIDTLGPLTKLIASLYGASILFVLLILWPVCMLGGVSLWKLIRYIREEIFITLGTISSAAVLPRLLEKMERLGVEKPVVGFVLPAGYSLNLVGSAIYMTLAPIFIAQALGIPFGFKEQAIMFFMLIFTSKAMAGVAGSSIVVILAALDNSGVLPAAGLALILGVERIQNEMRSTINLLANSVATIFLARTEKAIDLDRARRVLNGEVDVEASLETGDDALTEGLEAREEARGAI